MSAAVQNHRDIVIDHAVYVAGPGHSPREIDVRCNRPDYVTTEGVEVWMERKHQKTRFLDAAGNQVGPMHRNLVPAVIWAAAQGWRDPGMPGWFNDEVIAEVAAGGAS